MRIKLPRDKIIRTRTAIGKSLVSERILLRPLSRDDLPYIQKWSRDAELRRLTGEVASMSRTGVQKWYKELLADKDRTWYAIVLRKSGRVIGEAGLLRIFWPWRNTDMSIIIGEKDEQGK